jgi:hypothetical protein
MKTKTALLPLVLYLLYSTPGFSQLPLYTQSHKEIEYNYGVIADEDLNLISEIEKIKYEFRYSERTLVKTIDADYESSLDLTVDSDGYEQPWMTLAKRFHYDRNGISYYDKSNFVINTVAYDDDQHAQNNQIKENTELNGYHPGLATFPVIDEQTHNQLLASGYRIQTNDDETVTELTAPNGEKDIFNSALLTITHEWTDEDGLKNSETDAYEPYLEYKGYLLRMNKREKFKHSENGPCITEVRLVFYQNYEIADHAGLIDKATKQNRSVTIFPNPNDGIFNVETTMPHNESIIGTMIVNLMTGEILQINSDNAPAFNVNIQNQPSGHYILRVITNQSTLATHFFKQ